MRRALSPDLSAHPLEAVRAGCARVTERAQFVHIDHDRLERYATTLPVDQVRATPGPVLPRTDPSSETRAAFLLTLSAINFGSGYFPVLAKKPGMSGYRTLEASLLEHFERSGPLSPAELGQMSPERVAALLGQSLESPAMRELMQLYARAWRDLGELLGEGGSFWALVAEAGGSAEQLVRRLLDMPLYRDVSRYQDLSVPFLKRAQLCAGELARAFPESLGRFRDLDRLTVCADNLVAHVLRMDGLLRYHPELLARIEREELIPAGSPEEVEIRACEVQAVELLATRLEATARPLTPHELDLWLWSRGAQPRYKARPRHRTRCAFY